MSFLVSGRGGQERLLNNIFSSTGYVPNPHGYKPDTILTTLSGFKGDETSEQEIEHVGLTDPQQI